MSYLNSSIPVCGILERQGMAKAAEFALYLFLLSPICWLHVRPADSQAQRQPTFVLVAISGFKISKTLTNAPGRSEMLLSKSRSRSTGEMRTVPKNKRPFSEKMASGGHRFSNFRIGIRSSLQPSSLCISSRPEFSRLTVGKFGGSMSLLPVAMDRNLQVLFLFQGPPIPT